MKKNKQKAQGPEIFDQYYSSVIGAELWPRLKEALLTPNKKVSLLSPFETESVTSFSMGPFQVFDGSKPGSYELDPASLVVAIAMDLNEGDRVLDLCAAPGGKSLALMYRSKGQIDLTCNELSLPRFKRLRAVLRDHLPSEIYEKIDFRKSDGSRFGLHQSESYDQVLLDAPCSGERHLLETASELEIWTEKRGKGLHQRQVALICSAFDCLKPGGSLVYSTCSINPIENDGVIQKLLKKRDQAQSVAVELEYGEPTDFGRLILPIEQGWGPIYFAKVIKAKDE